MEVTLLKVAHSFEDDRNHTSGRSVEVLQEQGTHRTGIIFTRVKRILTSVMGRKKRKTRVAKTIELFSVE